MKITLSKPPALNHLYGTNKWGGKYLKAAGRAWYEGALWELRLLEHSDWECPVKMEVNLYTCRHQDNDSILKLLQDTLQDAHIYKDDYWIFELHVYKHKCPIKEERIDVEVTKIPLAGDNCSPLAGDQLVGIKVQDS